MSEETSHLIGAILISLILAVMAFVVSEALMGQKSVTTTILTGDLIKGNCLYEVSPRVVISTGVRCKQ